MTSDVDVRSFRRQQEFLAKGQLIELEEVKKNLMHRDLIDTTRKESPLTKAQDAVLLDNTLLSVDEQVEIVMQLAKERSISVEATS
jgi:cytidylate kinase